MTEVQDQLELRAIKSTDNLKKLSLGSSTYTPLKTFLKKAALDFHQNDIAKTYVLAEVDTNPGKVWGYVTLMNSEVILNEDQKPKNISAIEKYEVFPAVKIARLAIDKSLQGAGFGRGMIDWSVSVTKEKVMPYVGCRFLVVDAKKDSVSFYEKLGFELLDTERNKADDSPLMFFDVYKNQSN